MNHNINGTFDRHDKKKNSDICIKLNTITNDFIFILFVDVEGVFTSSFESCKTRKFILN